MRLDSKTFAVPKSSNVPYRSQPIRTNDWKRERRAGMPQTLNDIRALLTRSPGPDEGARARTTDRESQLTKPAGSLGTLEAISAWLSTWQGQHPPRIERPTVIVFAGNHGVTAQGVSAFPAEVTHQMVLNFQAGGAAINQLAKSAGAALKVIDVGVKPGTNDFTAGPAMTEAGFCAAFRTGMAAVDDDTDLLALGEMGIGNTTAAAAVCHALFGGEATDWTGPGTGVAGAALKNKIRVVGEAVARHRGETTEPLDLFRRLGGLEMVSIAGAVAGARQKKIPVVLDGYVCSAAGATLFAADERALSHCIVGHCSAEPGHVHLLERLGLEPLLNLGMRLGEGSGAALAISLIRAAADCHAGMATFAEAGVSDKD